MIVEPQDRVLSSDTGTTYLNNTLSNIVLVGVITSAWLTVCPGLLDKM